MKQLEYLPTPFLTAESSDMLEEYLSYVLADYSEIAALSNKTTTLDWRGILGLEPEEQEMPKWSARNTSWCLLQLCKEAKLV